MRTTVSVRLGWIAALSLAAACLPGCGGSVATTATPTSSASGITATPVAADDPLELGAASYSVAQASGSVTITVLRTGSAAGAASVDFSTADGTATAGTDYTATTGTLEWDSNDPQSQPITVPVSTSTPFAGEKAFSLLLSNPGRGAIIGNPGSATITITGAASSQEGTFVLADSSYSIAQTATAVTLSINRTQGSVGQTSVTYQSSDGTARAGTDYVAASGTLQWDDGDSSSRSVQVVLKSTAAYAGTKTFQLALTGAGGGAVIGDPDSATVSIAGSQSAAVGKLQLASQSANVGQAAGTVSVTVTRSGGSSGAASVNYATVNGTAIAGSDYTASSGTVKWADGDSAAKTITVGISDATPFSGSRSFSINLSSPSAGAAIANPGTTTVSITGNAATTQSASVFWVYQNGVFNWGGDYSTVATPNYKSTTGSPEHGNYDLSISLTGKWGLWLPYAGGTVPLWNFNASGYNYLTLDLKPTVANQAWKLYFVQVNDVPIVGANGQPETVNVGSYGPAPVVGKWATYRIPLSAVLTQYATGKAVYQSSVYKFGLQDQTGLPSNVWYVDNVGFTK